MVLKVHVVLLSSQNVNSIAFQGSQPDLVGGLFYALKGIWSHSDRF